ncbi:MAG: hypothetical protein FWG85_07145 [Bacteroidetes bacterium]|nr:hypothetical protein [Bacteroidota bacterium]
MNNYIKVFRKVLTMASHRAMMSSRQGVQKIKNATKDFLIYNNFLTAKSFRKVFMLATAIAMMLAISTTDLLKANCPQSAWLTNDPWEGEAIEEMWLTATCKVRFTYCYRTVVWYGATVYDSYISRIEFEGDCDNALDPYQFRDMYDACIAYLATVTNPWNIPGSVTERIPPCPEQSEIFFAAHKAICWTEPVAEWVGDPAVLRLIRHACATSSYSMCATMFRYCVDKDGKIEQKIEGEFQSDIFCEPYYQLPDGKLLPCSWLGCDNE